MAHAEQNAAAAAAASATPVLSWGRGPAATTTEAPAFNWRAPGWGPAAAPLGEGPPPMAWTVAPGWARPPAFPTANAGGTTGETGYPTAPPPHRGTGDRARRASSKRRKRKLSLRRAREEDDDDDEEHPHPHPPLNNTKPTTPKIMDNSQLHSKYAPFGNPHPSYPPYGPAYNSFGVPYTPFTSPWFLSNPDNPNPKNLAKRPRDWRSDYSYRGGICGAVARMGIVPRRSDVQEFSDPTRRNLSRLLKYDPRTPSIRHDIRTNPFEAPKSSLFLNLGRDHNKIDFCQLATEPPCQMMRLYHPSLPWYIDVKSEQVNGVTVHDILKVLCEQLFEPIGGRHYWTEDLPNEARAEISRAFGERVAMAPDGTKGLGSVGEKRIADMQAYQKGVVQGDFLGRRVIFEGLVRGKGGNWEMKFSNDEPERGW